MLQISKFAEFKEKDKSDNDQKVKPIFIVGVPRCGSTLIEKVIASGKKPIPMGEEVDVFESFINEKVLEKKMGKQTPH